MIHMFVVHQSIYIHPSINLNYFLVSGGVLVMTFLSWSYQQHINHMSNIFLQGFTISSSDRFEPPPHAVVITHTKWRRKQQQMLKDNISLRIQKDIDNNSYTQEQQSYGPNIQPLCLSIAVIFIYEREGWSGYIHSN